MRVTLQTALLGLYLFVSTQATPLAPLEDCDGDVAVHGGDVAIVPGGSGRPRSNDIKGKEVDDSGVNGVKSPSWSDGKGDDGKGHGGNGSGGHGSGWHGPGGNGSGGHGAGGHGPGGHTPGGNGIDLPIDLAARCSASVLQLEAFSDFTILDIVPELHLNGTFEPPADPSFSAAFNATLPVITGVDFCNVTIRYTHPGWNDTINTYVYLPFKWNGRFMGLGGGGLSAGTPATLTYNVGLYHTEEWAQAITDAGHEGEPSAISSTSFPLNPDGSLNWPPIIDMAYLHLHELSVISKSVIKAFYDKEASYAYFIGGSGGGRQAAAAAQRYPEDYDGIISCFPAINWNQLMFSLPWPTFVMDQVDYYPPLCETDAITAATIDECDELDGTVDGVVALPGLCNVDATSFVGREFDCAGTPKVITLEAATIMNAVWEGPRSSSGASQAWGYARGTNVSIPFGVVFTLCDEQNENCQPFPFPLSAGWASLFVRQNPTFTLRNISHEGWDQYVQDSLTKFEAVFGTNQVDLSPLRDSGTKLIHWHGTGDQLIPFNSSVAYYDRVLERQPDAPDYYRFYVAPGAGHSAVGGIAPLDSVVLSQMVDWVERGKAPDLLHAQGVNNNGVFVRRDLCQYPKIQHCSEDANEPEASACFCS